MDVAKHENGAGNPRALRVALFGDRPSGRIALRRGLLDSIRAVNESAPKGRKPDVQQRSARRAHAEDQSDTPRIAGEGCGAVREGDVAERPAAAQRRSARGIRDPGAGARAHTGKARVARSAGRRARGCTRGGTRSPIEGRGGRRDAPRAMGLAVLHSRALSGFDAPPVTVEVHLATGLPAFNLVGLPDTEVKESRDRVRAALQNAAFEFPRRKITVNLAPADLPKESGRFDLPIALGILAATEQIPAEPLAHFEFAGELALTGDLRPIRGALAMTLKAHRDGRAFVLPQGSAEEAALVRDAVVHPAT